MSQQLSPLSFPADEGNWPFVRWGEQPQSGDCRTRHGQGVLWWHRGRPWSAQGASRFDGQRTDAWRYVHQDDWRRADGDMWRRGLLLIAADEITFIDNGRHVEALDPTQRSEELLKSLHDGRLRDDLASLNLARALYEVVTRDLVDRNGVTLALGHGDAAAVVCRLRNRGEERRDYKHALWDRLPSEVYEQAREHLRRLGWTPAAEWSRTPPPAD